VYLVLGLRCKFPYNNPDSLTIICLKRRHITRPKGVPDYGGAADENGKEEKGTKQFVSILERVWHFTIKTTHLNCWPVLWDTRDLWVWPGAASSAQAKWNVLGASHHRQTGAAAPPWSRPPPGASSTPAVTVVAASHCLLPTTALVAIPWNSDEKQIFILEPTKRPLVGVAKKVAQK